MALAGIAEVMIMGRVRVVWGWVTVPACSLGMGRAPL